MYKSLLKIQLGRRLLNLALQKNSTWSLTKLPKEKRVVGCKCVFVVKFHSDGSIERFKARLVAKGFTQYQKCFSEWNTRRRGLHGDSTWLGRTLNITKAKVILKYDFTQSQANHTLFRKMTSNGMKTLLIVYVDDIIITGDNKGEIMDLKVFDISWAWR
ncbi:hypothetical protein GQ457_01G032700 [Hibiscus cannabinus]